MKKHIFGFVLFSLIVASFVLVYAFFNAPSIPPIEAVKPPISRTETREEKPYYCNLRKNKISYEVKSSEYDWEKRKFVSQLTIYWNGYGTLPKEILVEGQVFTLDNTEKSVESVQSLDATEITDPFKNESKAVILISSNSSLANKIGRSENLYVVFSIKDGETGNYLTKANPNLLEAYQVLINYGESSVIKPKKKLKM